MKTFEEIIEKNIAALKKTKGQALDNDLTNLANDTQICINVLQGALREHKNQKL